MLRGGTTSCAPLSASLRMLVSERPYAAAQPLKNFGAWKRRAGSRRAALWRETSLLHDFHLRFVDATPGAAGTNFRVDRGIGHGCGYRLKGSWSAASGALDATMRPMSVGRMSDRRSRLRAATIFDLAIAPPPDGSAAPAEERRKRAYDVAEPAHRTLTDTAFAWATCCCYDMTTSKRRNTALLPSYQHSSTESLIHPLHDEMTTRSSMTRTCCRCRERCR